MTTPDLSEFEQLADNRCKVGKAAAGLDPADTEKLEAALSDATGKITKLAIFRWCQMRGLDVSVRAIESHQAGKCGCPRA